MKDPIAHHGAEDTVESYGGFHTLVESVADAAAADLVELDEPVDVSIDIQIDPIDAEESE